MAEDVKKKKKINDKGDDYAAGVRGAKALQPADVQSSDGPKSDDQINAQNKEWYDIKAKGEPSDAQYDKRYHDLLKRYGFEKSGVQMSPSGAAQYTVNENRPLNDKDDETGRGQEDAELAGKYGKQPEKRPSTIATKAPNVKKRISNTPSKRHSVTRSSEPEPTPTKAPKKATTPLTIKGRDEHESVISAYGGTEGKDKHKSLLIPQASSDEARAEEIRKNNRKFWANRRERPWTWHD